MQSQALENLQAMTKRKPALEDVGIDRFLASTGCRGEFIKEIALVGNMTFHIQDVGLR